MGNGGHWLRQVAARVFVWIRRILVATGLLTLLTLGWLLSGLPLGLDGWLNVAAPLTGRRHRLHRRWHRL